MGQRQSEHQESLLGNTNDKCIGNRKVRTITLSLFLIAFFVLGLSYFLKNHDAYDDHDPIANAWLFIVIGALVSIGSAIFAILLFFINCDDKVGRVAGVGLIVGGVFYIFGWCWYIQRYTKLIDLRHWPDDTEAERKLINQMGAKLACWFGEALLPSGTAIVLGVDVFMHLFDKESHRLAINLAILFVVSAMCSVTYYNSSGITDDVHSVVEGLQSSDSYAWIATGYAIIWCTSLLYIVLYICTCCTCNCKDTWCARLIHAIGLIAGGILTCIGYYMYAGDLKDTLVDDTNHKIWYFIGYTVLIGGCCLAWAMDIALRGQANKPKRSSTFDEV
eukprot:48419_1